MKKLIIAAIAAIALVLVSSCNKAPESLDGTTWSTKENEAGWVLTLKFTSDSDVVMLTTINDAEDAKGEYDYTYTKGKLTINDGETEIATANVYKEDMTLTKTEGEVKYLLYKK